jgi:hypothetical protein
MKFRQTPHTSVTGVRGSLLEMACQIQNRHPRLEVARRRLACWRGLEGPRFKERAAAWREMGL